jgi:release factor glutamine methyltransferase
VTGPDQGPAAPGDEPADTVAWRVLLDETAQRLADAGVASAAIESKWLVEEASGSEGADLLVTLDEPATVRGVARLDDMVARRCAGEPVQYVLGHWSFRTLDLLCDRRVLIPRPETELLVDLAQDRQRVLDVGTGSGAVALAIANERTGVRVTGIDNSPDAVEVARANAARLGLEAEFLIADLIVGGPYELIVSNPPYVREAEFGSLQPEISLYEPQDALLAGADGLDIIRDLIPAAADVLIRGGRLAIEVGQGQSRAVESLFERSGFAQVEAIRDLAGIPRVVTGRAR